MTDDDIARLRALALTATPGPWHVSQWVAGRIDVFDGNGTDIAACLVPRGPCGPTDNSNAERTMRYIAAVSPSVVLALLDEIERLRSG